jgi:hypothetical protein
MKDRHLLPGKDLQIATHSNRGTTVLSPYEAVLIRLEIDPAQVVNTMFSAISDLMNEQTPQGFISGPASEEKSALLPPVLYRPA